MKKSFLKVSLKSLIGQNKLLLYITIIIAFSGLQKVSAAPAEKAIQQLKINGIVADAQTGEPLPGVSIAIEGTVKGTVSDFQGKYILEVPEKNSILVFSYVGYLSEKRAVGEQTVIDVKLSPDIKKLDDVVIVGYGQQKRLTTTGSVQSVSGADLMKAPVAGISNALVGLASGMQFQQSTGEFGKDQTDIRIRGIATLNTGGASPLILIDGVQRETYNNLDPNEIENISVLKDASATAVFGVRGANGVIIITTKQGKAGKPQVSFSSNLAAIQPTVLPHLLSSYDYAVLHNEAEVNMGKTPTFSDEDLRLYQTGEDPVFHPSKNWVKELIAPSSFQQSYNVNMSGGTDKMRYYTSLGYFNQFGGYNQPQTDLGIPFKQDYNRYNIRMNFDFDLTKDFSLSIKLGDQVSDNSFPNGGAWAALDKATGYSPMSSPGFVDGKYIIKVQGLPTGVPNFNPWTQAGQTSTGGAYITDDYSNTINTNVSLKLKLDKVTQGLSLRAMGAYDSYYMKEEVRSKYYPSFTILKDPSNPNGYIMYQSDDEGPYYNVSETINDNTPGKWRKMYGEAGLEYARQFGRHHITGLYLFNMQKAYYPNLGYKLPTGYLGMVARVTYDYKSKYLTEFNMGYNGSENFPEGKRFGFFPSVSLGWNMTEESFLPKNEYLTYLKIRGSYGEVGNDKIGGSRYMYVKSPYALGNGSYQATVFGMSGIDMARYNMYKEGSLGNPNVTWEVAKKWNLGADMKFFKDKLSFTGDYFEEKRDNILWNLGTVPEMVAATLPPANIGKVENKGFELEAGFNDKIGTFQYWLKGVYSFARNKISYSDEPTRAYEWLQTTGRPVGQYYGLTFEGFYNTWDEINDPSTPKGWNGAALQPGDMKYKDLNNDGIINEKDKGPIGFSNWPEINYSFSFGASWKGFDFSVLFQGVGNVSVYYNSKAAFPFTADWGAAYTWNLERWTADRYVAGEKIDFPRLELSPDAATKHNYQQSTFWVQDGSYVRLKNAEIGYRFSPGFLKRLGVSSMRIYANGNNLFTWKKMKYDLDPDARESWGRIYPTMKVFNGGINFQF